MSDCSKTEEYISESKRMCEYYSDNNTGECCGSCPFYPDFCLTTPNINPENAEEAIRRVQKWSDEHPAPKPKTYADDFFEKFPNATRKHNNIPFGCRGNVYGFACKYYDHEKKFDQSFCEKCWLEPYEEQEENK